MTFYLQNLTNGALTGTLAPLCGSAIGASVPVLSNVILQRGMTQRELLNHQIQGLESLYSDFILVASRLMTHSMSSSLEEPDKIIEVYALAARIRLNSSAPVIDAAEGVVNQILTQYGEPNLTAEQMRNAVLASRNERMDVFTSACRTEMFEVFKRGGTLAK